MDVTHRVPLLQAMKATMPKIGGDEDDLMDEDSDDIPSGLDNDSEDEEKADSASDEGTLSLAEASDNDDLMPFEGLLTYDGSGTDDSEEEWGGFSATDEASNKRKHKGGDAKKKRKKMRSLPTFASYEEYAKVIEDAPEDNV